MRIPYARSILGLFSTTRRMREDWDLRARRNALYYIDCGHGASEEAFWRSGEEDLTGYILRDLDVDLSAAALEIGCGIGRLLRPLAARVAHAAGIDISGEMIERAREALADLPNVSLARTDGDLAGVADASLDLVYSHIVFQHIPAKAAISRYIAEAARVLKGAGAFRFQVDGRREGLRPIRNSWHGARYGAAEIQTELGSRRFELLDLAGEGTQYMWVTARRLPEGGRPDTTAIRFRPKAWDAAALDGLLARLGHDPAQFRDHVVSGRVGLRGLSEPLIAKHRGDPPRAYVAAAYRALLGREPDEEGLAFYAGEIEQGIDRTNVVDCLLASAEFDAKHRPSSSTKSTAALKG